LNQLEKITSGKIFIKDELFFAPGAQPHPAQGGGRQAKGHASGNGDGLSAV
jgi:hypothetical protein